MNPAAVPRRHGLSLVGLHAAAALLRHYAQRDNAMPLMRFAR